MAPLKDPIDYSGGVPEGVAAPPSLPAHILPTNLTTYSGNKCKMWYWVCWEETAFRFMVAGRERFRVVFGALGVLRIDWLCFKFFFLIFVRIGDVFLWWMCVVVANFNVVVSIWFGYVLMNALVLIDWMKLKFEWIDWKMIYFFMSIRYKIEMMLCEGTPKTLFIRFKKKNRLFFHFNAVW